MHARLANFNIPAVQRVDDRTIEVTANGLPLWHGSQLAIDTTLVSPLTSAGQPRRRGGEYAAAALHTARHTKENIYPELFASNRCRLVLLGLKVGGRWSMETVEFLRLLAQHNANAVPVAASNRHFTGESLACHPHACCYACACGIPVVPAGRWGNPRGRGPSSTWATRPTARRGTHPQLTSGEVRAQFDFGLCSDSSVDFAHVGIGQYKNCPPTPKSFCGTRCGPTASKRNVRKTKNWELHSGGLALLLHPPEF